MRLMGGEGARGGLNFGAGSERSVPFCDRFLLVNTGLCTENTDGVDAE